AARRADPGARYAVDRPAGGGDRGASRRRRLRGRGDARGAADRRPPDPAAGGGMTAFVAIIQRDVLLALRTPGDSLTVVAFFVIAVVLFPFGVGPEPQLLARIASGVIWVTALLACLLSLDRLFALDHDDGSLDLILLAATPV